MGFTDLLPLFRIRNVVLLFAFSLTACGGGGSSSGSTPQVATVTIGSAGGAISTPAGNVSLNIPPGALATEQEITIILLDAGTAPDPLSTTGGMLDAGAVVVNLSPDGLTFAVPVTITVELPGAATPVTVGSIKGFSVELGLGALSSGNGTTEPLTNPAMSVDPGTGTVTLTAEIFHFSRLTWNPLKGADSSSSVTVDVFGYQATLTVGTNVAIVSKAKYGAGVFDQLRLNWTDESVAPFNLIGGAGTFPLFHEFPHVGPYTCGAVGTGAFKVNIGIEVVSTHTMPDPFGGGLDIQALSIGGALIPASFLVKNIPYDKPVDCIAEVSGGGGDGGNQNAGTPQSTTIELFTGIASATVVEVGQTFTIVTSQEINPLFVDNGDVFRMYILEELADTDLTVTLVDVRGILGPGTRDGTRDFYDVPSITGSNLVQEWKYTCVKAGIFKPFFFTGLIAKTDKSFEVRGPIGPVSFGIRVECVKPAPPIVSFAAVDLVLVGEGVGSFTLTVVTNIPAPEELLVNFQVNMGASTAEEGPDFNFNGNVVVIPAGASSADLLVTIEDDLVVEETESLVIELLASPLGTFDLASPIQSTISIQDDDTASGGGTSWISPPTGHFLGESTTYHWVGAAPGTMFGLVSNWIVNMPGFIRLESLFAILSIAQLQAAVLSETGPRALVSSEIGTPIFNGVHFESTPSEPIDITLVAICTAEGSGTITGMITDGNGVTVETTTLDVTCSRPPPTAACLNATTGLEVSYECNNDLVGTITMADIFEPTVIDVSIGGGAGRVVPGGTTLHLPLTISGEVPSEADFSASGWDGSISPPANLVATMFGLNTAHQYLFIQYESGVDLVDLSSPGAAPVYTGLLDYPGRAQNAEFKNPDDFLKPHDYFVMPVHGISGDYLIGCGTDVVRHDYNPAANNGAGAFEPTAERISDGFELCRDIWTDTNVNGVAPGYAYTTKTISKSQKTTRWLEDGFVGVTLDGDWVTHGVDSNNRIMGGAGGFFGENTLLASRGLGELGLWSGPLGDAPEGSVTRVSSAAFFQDVRCVGSLCIATSSDTITTLLWPDRTVAPSVHQNSSIFSLGLSARNMVVAANGNIYLLAVSNKRVVIGRVSPEGGFGGTMMVDISSVCTDPQGAQVMDMNHLGILCRTDNQFKVLEFLLRL